MADKEILALMNSETEVAEIFAINERALEEKFLQQLKEGEHALLCAKGRAIEEMSIAEFKAPVEYVPMLKTIETFQAKGYVFEKRQDGKWCLQPKMLKEHILAEQECKRAYFG